jgi:nascent polypeptide-associated complex subunit alpha
MFPGMNPRKMNQMMQKMGIQQVEVEATEVIIRTPEKEIVITNPSVQRVNMMGQKTFQISGEEHERSLDTVPEINEEDIRTVMEQAGVSEEDARRAIEEAEGDLASAIMSLSE